MCTEKKKLEHNLRILKEHCGFESMNEAAEAQEQAERLSIPTPEYHFPHADINNPYLTNVGVKRLEEKKCSG